MNMIWTILFINAVTGILLTCSLLLFRLRFSLTRWLDGEAPDEERDAYVSVIIAARNEERSIEKTLTQLSAMPEVLEVLVVDDASDDETLNIVQRVASRVPQIQVYSAPPLPEGWIGKSHAIHWVSQYAKSAYLLFTDADIDFHDLPLGKILERMRTDGIDHVGGMFRLVLSSASEAVCGPVLGVMAFVALGFSAFRHGSGTGAFNLVNAATYRRLGGHTDIKMHVVDDVALARMFKRRGCVSVFCDVCQHVSVRLFEGIKGYASAVSRSAVPFLGRAAFMTLALALLGMVLSATLAVVPALVVSGHRHPFLAGLIAFSVLPYVFAGWLYDRSFLWGLLSPVGFFIMTAVVSLAAVQCLCGMQMQWRGRVYADYD